MSAAERSGRGTNPASLANLRPPWKAGEHGGGSTLGGAQSAKWKRAIAAAVTEEMCVEVVLALKEAACGVQVQIVDRTAGEARIVTKPPDSAAARLFFEVLRVIGPDAVEVDLSTAPTEVLDWLEANGKGN